MTIKRKLLTLAIPAAFTLATAQIALAGPTELLTNGDFELGGFAGWTVTDLLGGSGSFFQDTPGSTRSAIRLAHVSRRWRSAWKSLCRQ